MNATRVTKREWYAAGGFRNPKCYRVQKGGSGWQYYIRND